MALIRPRLNDFYNLSFTQSEVDFAIPFLDEDIPLFVDPFLLWKSPSLQDNSLHTSLINCFNNIVFLANQNKEEIASRILRNCSECEEVGLGFSETKKGLKISEQIVEKIIKLFKDIPQIRKNGLIHFEEIQLYIEGMGPDRVSDFTCSFLKSFLVDYTIEQSKKYNIPLKKIKNIDIYDYKKHDIIRENNLDLPINPETKKPVLLIPKRWLRKSTWINSDDYFRNFYPERELKDGDDKSINRVTILDYNRKHYDIIQSYIKYKEKTKFDCKNDPLFKPIPVFSTKRILNTIIKLPLGKKGNADRKYEDYLFKLMASLLYPDLDFAIAQSRTYSGVLIRDLIFYNNRSMDFLKDIFELYQTRQIVFEIKNVKELENEHINQLNRYITNQFGNFGIIITRNRIPKKVFKNTVDLWSGQRKCIIIINDKDLQMMVSVFESRQRKPIEVVKKKYIEFTRECPS